MVKGRIKRIVEGGKVGNVRHFSMRTDFILFSDETR